MKFLALPQVKMAYGFVLLLVIAILAGIIAIKHVEQSTSFGLEYLLGGLTTLAGAFANWAFGESRSSSGVRPASAEDEQKNVIQ